MIKFYHFFTSILEGFVKILDNILKIVSQNMVELYETTLNNINTGNFPLNHDCILKVEFSRDCLLRVQFFTCRAQDSGMITIILSKLFCVKKVVVSSVDEFS